MQSYIVSLFDYVTKTVSLTDTKKQKKNVERLGKSRKYKNKKREGQERKKEEKEKGQKEQGGGGRTKLREKGEERKKGKKGGWV